MAVSDLAANYDDDRDLVALIEDEITSSTCFDNDGYSTNDVNVSDGGDRQRALEYYSGEMKDLPAEQGWSGAISRDVSDTIDQLMPGLMRVFAGSDDIVKYQPTRPEEEEQAKQASDFVNYLWSNECEGYLVLKTAIMDALQVRNGVVKAYWDKSVDYEMYDLTGLSQDQVAMIVQDETCQILGHAVSAQAVIDPSSGQAVQVPVYAVRVRRTVKTGQLRIECVPPEDFGIASNAKSLDKRTRFAWHRTRQTRSDLIADGYDRDVVEDLPAYVATREIDLDRNPRADTSSAYNKAMDEMEVIECYPMVDTDGDGIAERRKVVIAGNSGSRQILSNDPFSDETPFVDLKSQIVGHKWQGKSTADDVMDVQRIKTTLLRQMLNNLYQVNNPQTGVDESKVVNPDDLLRPKIGGVIRFKANTDVRAALADRVVPYIGDKALAGLSFQDAVIQKRTGLAPGTASLDATALDPQTATAEQIDHDAGYARTEMLARDIGHGLQALFRKVLRIIVENQDRPRTVMLRDRWVDFDPRAWNAEMDCSVKIGLGTGSRERDLAMLAGVGKQQDQIVAQLGPGNPIVTPQQYVQTRQMMVSASGLKNPEQFFTSITNDQFSQWQQSQPPKPDPAMEKVKAQIAGDQAKQQGQQQIEQQRTVAKAQGDQAKAATDLEIAKAKLAQEYALKMHEIELEAQLKAAQIAIGVHQANETQVAAPQ